MFSGPNTRMDYKSKVHLDVDCIIKGHLFLYSYVHHYSWCLFIIFLLQLIFVLKHCWIILGHHWKAQNGSKFHHHSCDYCHWIFNTHCHLRLCFPFDLGPKTKMFEGFQGNLYHVFKIFFYFCNKIFIPIFDPTWFYNS